MARFFAGILAAGLTLLAIGTLVARLWPKGELPEPAIVSAGVVGGICPQGPEGVGHVQLFVRVPGGAAGDESLQLGVEGGQRTFYDRVGEDSHRTLGFTEAALVSSKIEVTATMTRLDPGDGLERGRTVAEQVPCEEIALRLPARISEPVIRDCRRTLALRRDRICELALLRSEGRAEPGPYTEGELRAVLDRRG